MIEISLKVIIITLEKGFRKWIRYYLGFCTKYNHTESKKESLPRFIKKLKEKYQSFNQQKQASYAISLYYSIFQSDSKRNLVDFNKSLRRKIQHTDQPKQFVHAITNHYPVSYDNSNNLNNSVNENIPDFENELQVNDEPSNEQRHVSRPIPNNYSSSKPDSPMI